MRRTWLKNLLAKVSSAETRYQIYLDMTDIMIGSGLDLSLLEDPAVVDAGTGSTLMLQQAREQIQRFMAKWEPAFIRYFREQWSTRADQSVCCLWCQSSCVDAGEPADEVRNAAISNDIKPTQQLPGRPSTERVPLLSAGSCSGVFRSGLPAKLLIKAPT